MKQHINFIILLNILFFYGCSANSQTCIDSVEVNGLEMRLLKENDTTILKVENKGEKLNVKGKFLMSNPTTFVKKKGLPQYYPYSNLGIDYVFVIIGDTIDDNSETNIICGEKIQGLIIKGNNAYLTDRTLSGNITCSDYILDEKIFFDFANY